ncbi:SMI1/KNR4 family protein [Agrobacterium sp. NPDC090273]|uniref:SMI1/KNR4 family protein n=1 Tax=Agrobacterium sp. NPDC090273 TaxID=3363919 RepID=UPI00383A2DE9
MVDDMDEVIDEVNRLDHPSERKKPLPSDALVARYEVAIGLEFPEDYKKFLKNISNAFVGYLSPLTLNEDMAGIYGELSSAIEQGRAVGVPRDWLPICEDNGDYYCMAPDGKVHFWDHNGPTAETWPDIATWVKDVWLGGK